MAIIYLLRHAHSIANGAGILAGRSVGNPLSPIGMKQARALVPKLANEDFAAIYYSPLERCLQTITPLVEEMGKRPRRIPEFLEMDYGDWTGQALSLLRKEPLWREIQRRPANVRFPRGESFLAANRRVTKGLNLLTQRHCEKKVLVVSHGDIIKIALAGTLGIGLDRFQRLIVDPASLSIIDWKSKAVLSTNTPLVKNSIGKRASRGSTSNSNLARRDLGGGTNV